MEAPRLDAPPSEATGSAAPTSDATGSAATGSDAMGSEATGSEATGSGGDGRRCILLLHRRQGSARRTVGVFFDLEKVVGRERRGCVREL
jgi:hypothetical protein